VGKQLSITQLECASVALGNQHENGTIFKKRLFNIKCVL
jgi:hypothetical protein